MQLRTVEQILADSTGTFETPAHPYHQPDIDSILAYWRRVARGQELAVWWTQNEDGTWNWSIVQRVGDRPEAITHY